MYQRTTRVNPSEETIKIGPLGIRFLLTGDDSNGGVSVFEVLVPAGQKLAAPAHKNDAFEEILYGIEGVLTWTVDGTPIEVGPGQALWIPPGFVADSVEMRPISRVKDASQGPLEGQDRDRHQDDGEEGEKQDISRDARHARVLEENRFQRMDRIDLGIALRKSLQPSREAFNRVYRPAREKENDVQEPADDSDNSRMPGPP